MNIVLIGFKNAGKTSIGKLLAEKLNKPFIDTDSLIEQSHYLTNNIFLTARNIYQDKGGKHFRDIEKTVILTLNNIGDSIIATGGGTILDNDNVAQLKKEGELIYLSASFDTLLTRLKSQLSPAFLDQNQLEISFANLYKQRKNIYKKIADIEIDTDNKSILTLADEIIFLMRK